VKRLRVALETQFAYGTATGLGTYATRLSSALAARGDIDVVSLSDGRFDVWRFDRRLYWDQVRAPWLAMQARADVVHFTGGTMPWRAPHPCVLTLHDVAWLRGSVEGSFHLRWYFGDVQRRLSTYADRIAADSQCARDEIVERIGVTPAKVAVTGAGVDDGWFQLSSEPPAGRYVLCVGTVERRKDLITAVRALVDLPGVRLISAGPLTRYAAAVTAEVNRLGLADRVELKGYVSEGDLLDLYRNAGAFVFPSQYEGFGLPPLQALAAGLPVVASDIPVLREVLGDCALFARPGDGQSFAAALRDVFARGADVRERSERGVMWARQFTWSSVAERMTRVYRSLAG